MTDNALHRMTQTSPATSLARHQHLTREAQKLVSQTFFGALLKQMHQSPFRSPLLDGGRGGQAFQPLLDQHLADRMTRAAGKKLVRGIVRQIEGRQQYRKETDTAKQRPTDARAGYLHSNERIHVAPRLGNNLRA
jgi:Rod binding domain-containing protein